ncbi:hypothetical protein DCC79_13035 [bacterium]|nr:hypothetical protein [Chloroflexi bacterium CFX6]RIL08735.1 MAG: hypothetical protein DCC79_13035 [bacterium]
MPEATLPRVTSGEPVIAGALFHVRLASVHGVLVPSSVLAMPYIDPPLSLPSTAYIRMVARATGSVTPDTVNLRYVLYAGSPPRTRTEFSPP